MFFFRWLFSRFKRKSHEEMVREYFPGDVLKKAFEANDHRDSLFGVSKAEYDIWRDSPEISTSLTLEKIQKTMDDLRKGLR